ncbi:MAG: hypothetical protein QF410_14000 [Planctomycetota bacterium]|nr:hypothetical protein [Planctomycetota bacterium]MDP6763267.1 hypothetical protein [Planctomycetota bacterium]
MKGADGSTLERAAPFLASLVLLGAFLLQQTGPTAVVEPTTARHLRRVELTLAADRVPQTDRFVAHPTGAPLAEPPLFDTALALAARVLLGDDAGGAGCEADEARLERALSQVGPLSLVALLSLVYVAARAFQPHRRRAPALVAMLVVVASPGLVEQTLAGRLSIGPSLAVLTALALWWVRPAVGAREPLDRLSVSLVLGLTVGVGLALSPLFLGPALAVWATLLRAAWTGDPTDRPLAVRSGLLFAIGAIALGLSPTLDGPWQAAPPGPVAEWARQVAVGGVAGCGPFLLAATARARRLPGGRVVGLSVLAALALAGWARAEHLIVDPAAAPSLLGAWPLAFVIAVLPGSEAGGSPGLLSCLRLAGLTTLVTALADPEAVASFAVVAALTAGALPFALERPRLLRRAGAVLVAGGIVAGAGAVAERAASPPAAAVELAAALRHLRSESPTPGPWNAAQARQAWAVGCDPELAPLVHYHARRPTVDPAAAGGGDLTAWARSAGVRYLVAAGVSPPAGEGWDEPRSAGAHTLWRLAAVPARSPSARGSRAAPAD